MNPAFLTAFALACTLPISAGEDVQTGEWRNLTDGTTLNGWHVSAASGHSRTSGNKSGGRWVIEDGAIVGSQDVPGNGGLIVTDEQFTDFEVSVEMMNDFGPDSGLFLRSTEDGKAWQAMIDYHSGGNLMGIYGEGLGGKPHVRNYSFTDKVTEITTKPTGQPPIPLAVLPDAWPQFWRHGQWNELRARIVSNPPEITTWINGVKIMEWKETEVRHQEKGHIALQVHGGGDYTKEFVRYRNVRVRTLEKKVAAAEDAEGDSRSAEDLMRLRMIADLGKLDTAGLARLAAEIEKATAKMTEEVELAQPAADAGIAERKQITIKLDAEGNIRIGEEDMTKDQLAARLKQIAAVDKNSLVVIRAPHSLKARMIQDTMHVCAEAGLHRIAFATQAE